MLKAITREVSPGINGCELSFHERRPIDVPRAAEQHTAYENCLRELGVDIVSLPAEPRLPDSVFVEDTALVTDEIAIVTRPGAASRRPETETIAAALAPYRSLKFITAPATIDGGDVMRIGRSFFVGQTARTNAAAITQLRDLLRPHGYSVQAVDVNGCLHLKTGCSSIGENTILISRSCIDATALAGFDLVEVPEDEPAAANALLIGDTVIVAASFPNTQALLEERGFRVRAVDVSELQKAEAGVTCCSLIFTDQARHSRLTASA